MLEALTEAVDDLVSWDPAALADPDRAVALHRQLARLEAVVTRAVGSFDASQEYAPDGAASASAALAARCHLSKGEAGGGCAWPGPCATFRRRRRRGWPATSPRLMCRVLAGARRPATAEAMARDEAMLVGEAKTLHHRVFVRVVDYWSQHADPDGTEDKAADQRDRRSFHLSQSFEGNWLGALVLDPIGGTILANQLRRIEAEFFDADWAEARGRVGQGATVADLGRSPAQRRADALVEMARRAGTAPADGRRPEPLFTVLVDYETFAGRICELANGTVVSPGSLLPWLDEAWVERVVFSGPLPGDGRGGHPAPVRRGHPPGGGGARPGVLPPVLRPLRRPMPDRPHPTLGSRGADGGGQRSPGCGFHNRGRNRGP